MTRASGRRALSVLLGVALVSGCVFRTVREQQAIGDAVGTIAGTAACERAGSHPLVVVLLRRDGGTTTIVDHFVMEKPGRWAFRATAGVYGLAAFEDVNADLRYEPGEPALYPRDADFFALAENAQRTDLVLRIPANGRAPVNGPVDIQAVQARTPSGQLGATLGGMMVVGEVADLADPRFDPENGARSVWAPVDFIVDVRPGIYFSGPYDPHKTPVLFVHGIGGTPRNFAQLATRIDRKRLQPWFFYYPSGAPLDAVANALGGLVSRLHVRYHFPELYVVAHSMGGLVARAFVLGHATESGDYVTRLVTLATPWGGHAMAKRGVEEAPAVVRSWIALAPGSAFLNALFYEDVGSGAVRRRLPSHVRYGLLFAYHRNARRFGESSDGVIPVASQLVPEAQEDASVIRGFDETHASILESPKAAAALDALLH
jgi:pimeloyl-ACP methyl ester carboxylesterase